MKLIKKLPKWAIVTLCVFGFAALYAVYYIVLGNVQQMEKKKKKQNDLRDVYKNHIAKTTKGSLHGAELAILN